MTVVSNRPDPMLPAHRAFLAPAGSFTEETSPHGPPFVTYRADFVLECFSRFAAGGGSQPTGPWNLIGTGRSVMDHQSLPRPKAGACLPSAARAIKPYGLRT